MPSRLPTHATHMPFLLKDGTKWTFGLLLLGCVSESAMPRTSNSPLFPRIFLFGFFLHPNKIFKQRKNISRPFSPHFDVVCMYVMCTFKSSVVCKTTVLSFSRDEEMVLEDTPPSFSAFINISQ